MTFWALSSQLVKNGSTNTNLKRSDKVQNGRLPFLQDQKCSVSPNQVSKNVAGFFYIRGIIYYEFVPTGQTVNQVYYLEVLERLREKVRRKTPEHFCQQLMDLASRKCTCLHGTVCEGGFSYQKKK